MIGFAQPTSIGIDYVPLDTDYIPSLARFEESGIALAEQSAADTESCDVDFTDSADDLRADAAKRSSLVEIEPAEWIPGATVNESNGETDLRRPGRQVIGYQGYWPLTDREADVLNTLIDVHRGNARRTALSWLAAVGVSTIVAVSVAAAILWGAANEAGEFLLPKLVELGHALDASADGIDG
jgi:hypothetical protein